MVWLCQNAPRHGYAGTLRTKPHHGSSHDGGTRHVPDGRNCLWVLSFTDSSAFRPVRADDNALADVTLRSSVSSSTGHFLTDFPRFGHPQRAQRPSCCFSFCELITHKTDVICWLSRDRASLLYARKTVRQIMKTQRFVRTPLRQF